MLERRGLDGLAAHLEETYGVSVKETVTLDLGVFRVKVVTPDATTARWVARVFPVDRPKEAAEADARVLGLLERGGFPAERLAAEPAVSMLEGQPVLVTTFVEGRPARASAGCFLRLGVMLGRLHEATASPSSVGPGGAWHHLVPAGGPAAEAEAIRAALGAAGRRLAAEDRAAFDRVLDLAGGLDDGVGLPEALLHPDFVPSNAIEVAGPESSGGRRLTIVDWSGAGRGPRVFALGPLLWSAGLRDLDRVADVAAGYSRHVELEEAELDRLPGAIGTRWVVLDCWSWCAGRIGFGELRQRLPRTVKMALAIANRAQWEFR